MELAYLLVEQSAPFSMQALPSDVVPLEASSITASPQLRILYHDRARQQVFLSTFEEDSVKDKRVKHYIPIFVKSYSKVSETSNEALPKFYFY